MTALLRRNRRPNHLVEAVRTAGPTRWRLVAGALASVAILAVIGFELQVWNPVVATLVVATVFVVIGLLDRDAFIARCAIYQLGELQAARIGPAFPTDSVGADAWLADQSHSADAVARAFVLFKAARPDEALAAVDGASLSSPTDQASAERLRLMVRRSRGDAIEPARFHALVDALPSDRTPEWKAKLAYTVRMSMFKMCFEDGFVHADMHPGNMVVTDDGKLIIFDAGLAKLLGEDVLIQFIDMTKCLAMGTPDDLVNHLKRFHTYLGTIDWESLRVEVEAFATKFRSKDVAKLEYGELIGEMFAIGRKYRVHPVTDMMLVFVALITAQGIGKMLEPSHNVFGAVAQFLMPILMKRNEHIPQTAEAKAASLPVAN